KGVLFWDIVDVLREKNTPFVLLENVDRLLKSPASQRGRDFAVMLKTLDDLGYNVHWRVINAGEYSMPQKRRRVFILAFKKDTKYSISFHNTSLELLKDNFFNSIFPAELRSKVEKFTLDDYPDIVNVSDSYNKGKFLTSGIMQDGIIIEADIIEITEKLYTLSDIINESKEFNSNIEKYIIDENKIEKWKYLKGRKKIERVSKTGHKYIYSEGSMAFPENLDSPARTMLTSESTLNRSSHIIFDENLKKYRTLTPVEAEKIQMFPANWTDTMPDRNRFFMMGNALVTGIISRLEPRLREIIENE
ncbi:MAG: DNA (cytosine-5-)-methyltransferase, partial [Helcococcus sp.]|nr:DNA (cytosine-5-)-methyltransferase [Helcococcus sp.]